LDLVLFPEVEESEDDKKCVGTRGREG